MFGEYIEDAVAFYELAEEKITQDNERDAKMFYRASVFCGANSMEAFINLIGEVFKQGDNIDKNEIAYLNDKILEFSPSKIKVEDRTKYYAIDDKIKFIIKRFGVNIDIGSSKEWANYIKFKLLRDSLVHPKSIDDTMIISDYKKNIKNGLNSTLDIMNEISKKIFSKSLRKGLLKLKIE
jgi:hypothetical protein